RDENAEGINTREMLLVRQKSVLDGPSVTLDRLLSVRGFVSGQDFVDRSITYCVRAYTPSETIQLLHDFGIAIGRNQFEPAKLAVLSVRLFIGLAHPASFKPSIHDQLHAGDFQPFIAFIRSHARVLDESAHLRGIRI